MRAGSAIILITFLLAPFTLHGRADLKSLYDAHDWFALRDAVTADAPPFYRGAVAYAFNDYEAAQSNLEQAVADAPDSEQATEARGLLIYLYQRQGRFAQTLEQVRLIRKSVPDAPGLKNAEALFGALSGYPEQSRVLLSERLTFHYAVRGGNLFIPLEVNNAHANFMIDTGANFSVMSESEAKRLGLTVTESGATGTVVTGAQVAFRTALAANVDIGGARLRNVVFLISPDSNQPFVSLPRGWRGALGIPVLLAIERFKWTAAGDFELGREPDGFDVARANLCFEGVTPVIQGTFETKPLTLVLDTGATHTDLGPRFALEFPEAMRGGTRRTRVIGGVGDRTTVESTSVPEIRLAVGGFGLRLRPASVLQKQLATDDRWFFGRLGIDSLRQARAVTLDFRAMTLRLQP